MLRRSSTNNLRLEPIKAHTHLIPISKRKYDDLMALCRENTITPEYHNYYRDLPVLENETSNNSSSDEEISLQVMREKKLSKRRK